MSPTSSAVAVPLSRTLDRRRGQLLLFGASWEQRIPFHPGRDRLHGLEGLCLLTRDGTLCTWVPGPMTTGGGMAAVVVVGRTTGAALLTTKLR